LAIYRIYLCIRRGFNLWNNPFILISSYTRVSRKELAGLVSDNKYTLYYISIRSTRVYTKQFNSICNHQQQFCVLICFIRCYKNIKQRVPTIINNFSMINCLRSHSFFLYKYLWCLWPWNQFYKHISLPLFQRSW